MFIGAIIGLVYTFFIQTPLYKSEATMLVVGARTTQDATINNNYTELFKSRRVLEPVIQSKGYDGQYQQLLGHTTATNNKDTDVILVSMATTNARKSEELLGASLSSFKKEASSLYGSSNIKVVDSASFPVTAYNVNMPLQIGLSIIATVMLSIIVLFFIYDYYTSQVIPTSKTQSTRNSKPKKSTSKTKGKKSAAASVSRAEKFLNIFFKEPALVAKSTLKSKSTATK